MSVVRTTAPVPDYSRLPHRGDYFPVVRQNNPLFPLPSNYYQLGSKEQSWFRVNACCMQDDPEDFTVAFTFFFQHYLFDEESQFLENRRDSPAFHYQIVHDIAAFKLNAFAAPRGSCKSTLMRALVLFLLLTRRGYRVGGIFSVQKKARETISKVRRQLESNPFILEDFGRVAPKRGDAETWSNDTLELTKPFGSLIWTMCLQGASRGGRFDWLFIDDPELDPDSESVVAEWVHKLERRLKKTFIPMIEIASDDLDSNAAIARRGMGIAYFGTVIQENMLLARIIMSKKGSEWDFWNKWRFSQETSDGRYLWPERWGKTAGQLMRDVMTEEYFASEQLNKPGALSTGRFAIHPIYHTYTVDKLDDAFFTDPLSSTARVRYGIRTEQGAEPFETTAADLFGCMDRVLLVDWADTTKVSSTSDFTCIHAVGNDADGCVWSLDMEMDRFNSDQAAQRVIDMAMRWRANRVVMESVGGYGKITDLIVTAMYDEMLQTLGWVPMPYKLTYNTRQYSKGSRIDRVAWRFGFDKFRFPIHRSREWPYNELWHQVNNFTITLEGLRFDDAVDTLGFIPEVFKGKGNMAPKSQGFLWLPVNELLAAGVMVTPDGHQITEALPYYGCMTQEASVKVDEQKGYNERKSKYERRKRQFSGVPG